MFLKIKIVVIILLVFSINSVDAQSKREKKKALKEKEYQEVKKLIKSKNIDFKVNWASGRYGKKFNLIKNDNYLRIKGDSIFTYLLYFGAITIEQGNNGVGYGSRRRVEIKSTFENYKVEYEDRKQRILIKFEVKEKGENIGFYMTVFGEGATFMEVSRSLMDLMTYEGRSTSLKKDKKVE